MVDEPDQPAASWGALTCARDGRARPGAGRRRSTRSASAQGERVAIVSPELGPAAHRVLRRERRTAGCSCRSTSASTPTRSRYIVEHSGASVLLVDPELDDALARRRRASTASCSAPRATRSSTAFGVEPEPWDARRGRDRHHQLHERHDRAPEGRAAHAPQPLAQRGDVRLAHGRRATATCTCTRCRCSTATAGACRTRVTGMGGAARRAAQGRRRRDPAPGRAPRRHAACAARPRSSTAVLDAARDVGRSDPRARPRAHRRRRRAAADAHHRAGRDRARLGVHPDLRPHRDVAAAHDEPRPRRVRRPRRRRSAPRKLGRAGAPALGVRLRVDEQGEVLARSNVVIEGYWEQPEATADAIVDGWFHTGDGGAIDDDGYLTISDRKKDVIISRRRERVVDRGRGLRCSRIPAVAEVAVIGVPDEKWGETVKALVVLAPGRDGDRSRPDRALPRRTSRTTSARPVGRVPRRAGPHRHRQAPEVQAPRALLGRALARP